MYDITYFVISFRNNGFLLFKKENGKNDIRKIITFRYDGISIDFNSSMTLANCV